MDRKRSKIKITQIGTKIVLWVVQEHVRNQKAAYSRQSSCTGGAFEESDHIK